MITKEKLAAMRENLVSQRDQAVGAIFLIDHLLAEWDKPDTMTTEEFAESLGGKLMREPEPIGGDDGKDSK